MKNRMIKIAAALGLLAASAAAMAATNCCGDIACCLQQWVDCCL